MSNEIRFLSLFIVAITLNLPVTNAELIKVPSVHEQLAEAKQNNQKLFLEFYSEDCASCQKQNSMLAGSKEFNIKIQDLAKVRIDAKNPEFQDLVSKYNVGDILPVVILANSSGAEVLRLDGAHSLGSYLRAIDGIKSLP